MRSLVTGRPAGARAAWWRCTRSGAGRGPAATAVPISVVARNADGADQPDPVHRTTVAAPVTTGHSARQKKDLRIHNPIRRTGNHSTVK
jgi:hypothetical protein